MNKNNIIYPSAGRSPHCCNNNNNNNNNSRYRRRKKQLQPGHHHHLILALISILSLGSTHAQTINNPPLTTTTTTNDNNNNVQNDNNNNINNNLKKEWHSTATTTTTTTAESYYKMHHPLLLNITQIESSPILAQRYDWVRQSSSLVHLLDYQLMMKIEQKQGNGVQHQNYNNKGQFDQLKQRQRKLDQVYNDDYNDNNNDDVNSNLYDDDNTNYAAAADDVYANADDAAVVYDVVYDDAYVAATNNDDANANNAANNNNDDDDNSSTSTYACEDKTCTINEQCTKFLFGFLEGTTDAKDNCEGINNAYVSADCGTINKKSSSSSTSSKGSSSSVTTSSSSTIYNMDDDFNDDYFGIFYDHQCCSSLRSHYYEYCDDSQILNGANLLLVAAVMLLCECAKSIVKKNRIRWLPEAASCMLVGMAVALGAKLLGNSIDNIGFDEEIFMYLLLPPIIFEAALSVNKSEFRRRRGAIMVFALFGTLLSSFLTGAATYYSAKYFGDASLSILDSLVFGSLISSIDPVAILSVLTSLKMSETDTIYILVFGESLLNDGIAITLFKSLVQQYESKEAVSLDDILGSIADFLIIAFGSCAIGLACGVACLCYFHLNSSILHPVMEVASFFLWAVVPYWISEAIGCSGIVAIVVMGFFMDMYLRPGWDPSEIELANIQLEEDRRQLALRAAVNHGGGNLPVSPTLGLDYYNWDDDGSQDGRFRFRGTAVDIPDIRRPHSAPLPPPPVDGYETSTTGTNKPVMKQTDSNDKFSGGGDADTVAAGSRTTIPHIKSILLKQEFVRMSREADEHVRFVAHLLSSLSENAIFAYLGLFLFSGKYKWDGILCSIGVITCILSRAVMVVCASWFIWYMHIFRQRMGCNSQGIQDPCIDECLDQRDSVDLDASKRTKDGLDPLNAPISKSARALSNYKVQIVLILAGLRGAVSLALVESVPIYNGVTGVGSMNKPLLKAMTSSAIIVTIFVLGGGSYYILKWLDISDDDMLIESTNKRLADRALSGYAYPPLVCGGYNYDPPVEMELSTAPSWRNYPHSPGSMREAPRVGYMAPPSPSRIVLQRSRSDWSRTSHDSAGLNAHDHHRDEDDIIHRKLNYQLSSKSRGSQSVHTDTKQLNSPTDTIDESTPELDESPKKSVPDDNPPFLPDDDPPFLPDDDPPFPPEIV